MPSSSLSSSSFGKRTLGQPLCFCEVEATLRYSNTKRNPGRPFLGCPKYNKQGLPYCRYFKWADGVDCSEPDLEGKKKELLRKEEELEKRLKDVIKREIELRNIVDDIEKRETVLSRRNEELQNKELVLLEREAVLRRSRMLPRVFWGFVLVVCCYLLSS